MDTKTKAINYASIVGGIIIGVATGWIIYKRLTPSAVSSAISASITSSPVPSHNPAYYSDFNESAFPMMRSTSADSSNPETEMAENSLAMATRIRPSGMTIHRRTGSDAIIRIGISNSVAATPSSESFSAPSSPWCEEKGLPFAKISQ
jgi:hypothetical protein